jgi:serine/threonine protein kinase
VLGQGNFGRVVKGKRAEVQDVAIKMTIRVDAEEPHGELLREIAMLKFISCDRNVVQFYGACIRSSQLWLITEVGRAGEQTDGQTGALLTHPGVRDGSVWVRLGPPPGWIRWMERHRLTRADS